MKRTMLVAAVALAATGAQAVAAPESEELIKAVNACYESFNSQSYDDAFKNCERAASVYRDPQASNLMGAMYENGWGTQQDYAKAADNYKAAASADLADANNNLANLYLEGKGVRADEQDAHFYFEKAARLGNTDANLALGMMAANPKSDYYAPDQAAKYFKASADAGNSLAQTKLGVLMMKGGEVNDAIPYLQKASEQGNAEAMEIMADIHMKGEVVRKDPQAAFELYRKAADLGRPQSSLNAARMFRDGVGTGINYVEALNYFEKAAKDKNQDAMIEGGMMYLNGQGTDPNVLKGMELIQRAAAMGNVKALTLLGDLYTNGKHVPISAEKAFAYYYSGAKLGDPQCQTQAGGMLLSGAGTHKDPVEGVDWLKKAANKDYVPALMKLGEVYYTDNYGYKDHETSKSYFRRAAELGSEEAQEIMVQRDFE